MDLRDIEICSFGLTSLHRQRRRCPCPETKSFGTSRDQSVQGSHQHCNRQCLRMDKLRHAANVQSSAYIGIAAILAVFILTFATASKARAQDNGHHPHHADHHSKWNSQVPTREISLLRETRYVGQSSPYFPGGRDASFAETPTLRHSSVPANALAVPGMQKSFRLRRGRYGSRALPRD